MKRLLSLLALLLAALATPALAQDFPARPDGPVLDQVDIIPAAEEAALDRKLRAYNEATGRAIVVATIDTTGGEDIDTYSVNLAETWGIGGAETDEGVLLLIALGDRQMAIKTGSGVQDRLTDINSGRIIRNTLRPAFRAGDFAGGIDSAVDQMIERLDLSPADAKAIAEAEAAAERDRASEGGFPFGVLFWMGIAFFFFILPMLRERKRRRKYRSKGKGPWGKRRKYDDDWKDTATDIILWEVGSAIVRGALSGGGGRGGFGGGRSGGGGSSFGGFGGGGFNGGGASGGW